MVFYSKSDLCHIFNKQCKLYTIHRNIKATEDKVIIITLKNQ